LDLCKFKKPPADEITPNPILPGDFREILSVAKNQGDTKAVLCILLAANGGYLPKEVGDIQKNHINLEKRTIVMNRAKTSKRSNNGKKVPRACYLWERTMTAIKDYQKKYNHRSQYLIVNSLGAKLTRSAVGNIWYRLRKKGQNKLTDKRVRFKDIRSGCRQAAAELEMDKDQKIKYLLGQRSVPSVDDHYLQRRPSLMKDFCLEMEKYFFNQ
jgi:integrase